MGNFSGLFKTASRGQFDQMTQNADIIVGLLDGAGDTILKSDWLKQ